MGQKIIVLFLLILSLSSLAATSMLNLNFKNPANIQIFTCTALCSFKKCEESKCDDYRVTNPISREFLAPDLKNSYSSFLNECIQLLSQNPDVNVYSEYNLYYNLGGTQNRWMPNRYTCIKH